MKQFSLAFLLFAFTLAMVTPDTVLAKRGGDDDGHYEYSDDHDDDDDDDDEDEDEDEDEDDDRDDDNSNDELEVEADVFTDITIVKVELSNGRKTVFTTTADTRAEVVDVVADRFDLTEAEVEDALDFEIEDRASRTNERAKISNQNNRPVDTCDDNSNDELEVEADVFTDTTIVKVELPNGNKTVFETSATTSDDVIEVVADRFSSLTEAEVEDALDFEIEDRASRDSDFVISSNNNDDCDDEDEDEDEDNNDDDNGRGSDAELRNRIAELQRLLQTLIQLFNSRFGN